MPKQTIKLGILGCGNVGAELAARLIESRQEIANRTGIDFQIVTIGVRDLTKSRDARIDSSLFTDDLDSVVANQDTQIVVEVMGGMDPASDLIRRSLAAGKPVITANKELIAAQSSELFELARANSVDLLFEAAVGGGVPIIRPLRESLAGENITSVAGIINGTTNFVLTKMMRDLVSLDEAITQAQALGYAETDASYDIEGRDAAAKAAILASLSFGSLVSVDDVRTEGIRSIDSEVIEFAIRMGFVVKPLAVVSRTESGAVSAFVSPSFVPEDHPLASVNDVYNAVFIEGDSVGSLMLYGPGAGGGPTASAVLGDLVDSAHNLLAGGAPRLPVFNEKRIAGAGEMRSAFFVEIRVEDQPGVLGAVATEVGDCGVSIKELEQVEADEGSQLLLISHVTSFAEIQNLVKRLESLSTVTKVGCVLPVFGDVA